MESSATRRNVALVCKSVLVDATERVDVVLEEAAAGRPIPQQEVVGGMSQDGLKSPSSVMEDNNQQTPRRPAHRLFVVETPQRLHTLSPQPPPLEPSPQSVRFRESCSSCPILKTQVAELGAELAQLQRDRRSEREMLQMRVSRAEAAMEEEITVRSELVRRMSELERKLAHETLARSTAENEARSAMMQVDLWRNAARQSQEDAAVAIAQLELLRSERLTSVMRGPVLQQQQQQQQQPVTSKLMIQDGNGHSTQKSMQPPRPATVSTTAPLPPPQQQPPISSSSFSSPQKTRWLMTMGDTQNPPFAVDSTPSRGSGGGIPRRLDGISTTTTTEPSSRNNVEDHNHTNIAEELARVEALIEKIEEYPPNTRTAMQRVEKSNLEKRRAELERTL